MNEGDLFDDLPGLGGETPTPKRAEATRAAEPEPVPDEPGPPQHTPLPRTGSLGQTMAALRRDRGMSIDAVANETLIKPGYLEALENDSFSELPHTVYVMAYVKKLCAIYGVADEDAEELVSELRRQLAYEIPEDIDKSVICREQDEETHRKLRQITAALIAGAALIVLVLVIGVTTLILRAQRGKEDPAASVESSLSEDWLAGHRKPVELKTTSADVKPPQR